MTMSIGKAGLKLVKSFEGLRLTAYQDEADVWTIGYGHTATAKEGKVITEERADLLLLEDLAEAEEAVNRLVKVEINQNQFDALVSFTFNVGAGALKESTALKRLNNGKREEAAEAMTWWNKLTENGALRESRGLTKRRHAEASLFLS